MGTKPTLLWRFYPSFLLIVLLSVIVMCWYVSRVVTEEYTGRAVNELVSQAHMVQELIGDRFSAQNAPEIDAILKKLGKHHSSRITVALQSGTILGDSQLDLDHMDQFFDRPEIKEAFSGKTGIATRKSLTMNATVLFVAIPIQNQGHTIGVVRAASPEISFDFFQWIRTPVFWILLLGLPALLSFYWSRKLSKSLHQYRAAAEMLTHSDLEHRLNERNTAEFEALTDAMNTMSAEVHSRIAAILRQRNELEAVLSGMLESVMVVDIEERIMRLNKSAERLFRTSLDKVKGKTIQEAIRHTELHRFVADTLACGDPLEGDIMIIGPSDVFLQARGSTLRDTRDNVLGALIVLNDVTRLKTLENIRRDFVANVSHELKTPITSIKGFLETLREGAWDDRENAERFMDIMLKHTNRLDAIIDDLLSLSRIERDTERGEVILDMDSVRDVLDLVVREAKEKAKDKNMTVDFSAPDELVARINPSLLEQALMNLVENSIKYSDPGKTISISADYNSNEIVIRVKDQGYGISQEHLSRIFERFYRVDKARDRKIGGTGLGLAIVKHIVHAHGGRIGVESSPGKGSTFSIFLPAGSESPHETLRK